MVLWLAALTAPASMEAVQRSRVESVLQPWRPNAAQLPHQSAALLDYDRRFVPLLTEPVREGGGLQEEIQKRGYHLPTRVSQHSSWAVHFDSWLAVWAAWQAAWQALGLSSWCQFQIERCRRRQSHWQQPRRREVAGASHYARQEEEAGAPAAQVIVAVETTEAAGAVPALPASFEGRKAARNCCRRLVRVA